MTALVVAAGCVLGILGVLFLRVSFVFCARLYGNSGVARRRAERATIRWRVRAGARLRALGRPSCKEVRKLWHMTRSDSVLGAHAERCGVCLSEVGYGR